jgi:hypothetical protein
MAVPRTECGLTPASFQSLDSCLKAAVAGLRLSSKESNQLRVAVSTLDYSDSIRQWNEESL